MTKDGERAALVAFLAQAVLAGGNPVGIRLSSRELEPLWGAGLRFAGSAAILLAVMAALRLARPRGRALAGSALYRLFNFGLSFALIYYAKTMWTCALSSPHISPTPGHAGPNRS